VNVDAGDTAAAVSFLLGYAPDGPWTLIHDLEAEGAPSRAWPAATFYPSQVPQLTAWINANQNLNNVYFVVNLTTDPPPRTSPAEDKMAAYRAIPLDIDFPPALRDAALAEHLLATVASVNSVEPPPTALIFSGGGLQGFWVFAGPVPLTASAEIERTTLTLAATFGGDHVQNVNRLMRLPGTINVLNDKKRRAGRIPAASYVISADWSRRYPAAPLMTPPTTAPPSTNAYYSLEAVWRERILSGATDWLQGQDHTKSAAVYVISCHLVRSGWSDDAIATILTDATYGIARHVLDQGNPPSYALKQARDARKFVARDFIRTAKGIIISDNYTNVKKGFIALDTTLSYDTFADRLLHINGDATPKPFGDAEEKYYRLNRFAEELKFRPNKDYFADAVATIAREHTFHPVVDYLSGLTWDNQPRIDTWLIDLAGAPDTPYVRAISRIVLVAAVARVRQPGVKFDEMLVFESPQGMNKSTALHVLAVREEWFGDSLSLAARDKEVIEQLAGKWLIEAADLSGMRKSDVETLKAFLSRQSDRARLAYGRFPVERPRSCVFLGTTNSSRYLRDDQNRRFWSTTITGFNVPALAAVRDQLWAEAAHLHALGSPIRLDPSLYDDAAHQQRLRRIEDPWVELLEVTFGNRTGRMITSDVWHVVDRPPGQRTQEDNRRLGEAMRELGWERIRTYSKGEGQQWFYARGTPEERRHDLYVQRDAIVVGRVNIYTEAEYNLNLNPNPEAPL